MSLRVITKTAELESFCASLNNDSYITVDTEFVRETTYWPKLCLIQIAGSAGEAVIDTCSPQLNLKAFYALMSNEKLLKVFHSARQDIEIIFNGAGIIPYPVLDTQIAAQVLGLGDQISYADLVMKYCGVAIDKSSRFTDWARRPLTRTQLEYAIGDVTHLYKITPLLQVELHEKKRAAWMVEEHASLLDKENYNTDPLKAYERLSSRVKRNKDLAALIELCAWRERVAQARDVPRPRVLKDDVLLEIALSAPQTKEALAQLRALPSGFENSRDGEAILNAIAVSLERDFATLPKLRRSSRASTEQRAIMDLLRVLLKMISENEGVAARIIADTSDLEAIIKGEDCHATHGWRLELFGEKALNLLNGEIALTYREGRVEVVELSKP